MKKLLQTFLVIGFSLIWSPSALFSEAQPLIEVKSKSEKKVGSIAKIHRASNNVSNGKHRTCFYILEDGYSLYTYLKGRDSWNVGDQVAIDDPYEWDEDDDDDEYFVEVKNLKRNKSRLLLRMGWASEPMVIVKSHYKKAHGERIVEITLEDGTSWKFVYFDESAPTKNWSIGDRVILLAPINNQYTDNPHPLQQEQLKNGYNLFLDQYVPDSDFSMINVSNSDFDMKNLKNRGHQFYSGEKAIPVAN